MTGITTVGRHRHVITTAFSLAVAALVIVFVVIRFDLDIGAALATVQGANPWLIGLAFLSHYSGFIIRGLRWRLLLRAYSAASGDNAETPSTLFCARALLLAGVVNSVGWMRAGDAYRAYLCHAKWGTSMPGTMGTVVAERVMDLMLVGGILLVSLAMLAGQLGGTLAWTLAGSAIGTMALSGVVVATLAAKTSLPNWAPHWLMRLYTPFAVGIGTIRLDAYRTTVLGLTGWATEIARVYLIASALGIDLSMQMVLLISLASSLLTVIPAPGGLGLIETGLAGLCVQLASLSAATAVALVLVERLITYGSAIVAGVIVYMGGLALSRVRPHGVVS